MPRSAFLACLILAALSANTATAQSAFTAADCSAFWYGRDDYARRSKLLPRDPGDIAMAKKDEAAAERDGGSAARSEIASSRADMMLLFEASIELNDPQSRDLMNRMTKDCTDLTNALP